MKEAIEALISLVPSDIREDILDDEHFKWTQHRLVLTDGYVEKIKLIKKTINQK